MANKDGTVTISIGTALSEVKRVAKAEKRSTSKQIAVIVLEWLEQRQKQQDAERKGA